MPISPSAPGFGGAGAINRAPREDLGHLAVGLLLARANERCGHTREYPLALTGDVFPAWSVQTRRGR